MGLSGGSPPDDRPDFAHWGRTPCPPNYTGFARRVGDEVIFACGSCPDPKACADADRCERQAKFEEAKS